jgi:hypothetical protein
MICGNQAKELPKTGDSDKYRCETCGEYGISGTVPALERWKNLSRDGRLRALATAKMAKPGEMPIITDYSF